MTLHTKLSYLKSAVRIVGYSLLIAYNDLLLTLAASALIAAELLGIAEEAWPGAYKGTETTDIDPTGMGECPKSNDSY